MEGGGDIFSQWLRSTGLVGVPPSHRTRRFIPRRVKPNRFGGYQDLKLKTDGQTDIILFSIIDWLYIRTLIY